MGIDKKTGYYSLREILGYNAKYSLVLTDRGRGKSWDAKHFLMGQEGTFMCVYRQQPDMALAMKDWIDPLIQSGFADFEEFAWRGSDKDGWTLLYRGAPKGWFRYLTQVNHIKQEVFPDDMNWVWFDEFIPMAWKKLPGIDSEGDALRTIVKTIEHDTVHTREEKGLKPVRVLMFANPFTWNNPILGYFHVIPKYGITRVGPGIVCEQLPPFEEKKSHKMTADEFLGDEVHKNQGWGDELSFIEKIPKTATPWCSVRMENDYYTLYKKESKVYVKAMKKHHKSPLVERWGTLEGLREDERCLDTSMRLKWLQSSSYRGLIRFEDINTKFTFLNALH